MQVFEEMQEQGITPTAVTYGCLLNACERLGQVDQAFDLYREACELGISPTDETHNILINVCTATGRCAALLQIVHLLYLEDFHFEGHPISIGVWHASKISDTFHAVDWVTHHVGKWFDNLV